ncbi:MAG: MBL fold metallo-hydrolase [Lentisphaeria bacterium]
MLKVFFTIFNIRRRAGKVFLLIIVISGVLAAAYLQKMFGELPTPQQQATFYSVPYYSQAGFVSPKEIIYNQHKAIGSGIWRFLFDSPNNPKIALPKEILTQSSFSQEASDFSIRWLGHSSAIIELSKIRILVDPVFDNAAFIKGVVRRYDQSPLTRGEIPKLDVVLITHDHYDHLEYATIHYLRNENIKFVVPLGVGSRLRGWGVADQSIIELRWDESFKIGAISITALTGVHYSGRSGFDKNSTLWASYAIKNKDLNIFWSGDTGYSEHFGWIGKKYGPFDLACMEIDGWNAGWPHTHLFPEEVVKASKDLKAKVILPIHWAVFDLAMHPWTESIEAVLKFAKAQNISVLTPKMGESIESLDKKSERWWRNLGE